MNAITECFEMRPTLTLLSRRLSHAAIVWVCDMCLLCCDLEYQLPVTMSYRCRSIVLVRLTMLSCSQIYHCTLGMESMTEVCRDLCSNPRLFGDVIFFLCCVVNLRQMNINRPCRLFACMHISNFCHYYYGCNTPSTFAPLPDIGGHWYLLSTRVLRVGTLLWLCYGYTSVLDVTATSD